MKEVYASRFVDLGHHLVTLFLIPVLYVARIYCVDR